MRCSIVFAASEFKVPRIGVKSLGVLSRRRTSSVA